jgi:hypothetical protein
VAKVCEILKQLNGYQMDLAEVWSARIAASQVTMAHMRSRMYIILYAVSCNEIDYFSRSFAETMLGIASDCFHYASELFHLGRSSQAALEKERRL